METNHSNKPAFTRTDLARKLSEVELTIDSLAFGGKGVGRLEGELVIFVTGALPGDRVRALITKRKPQYAEARVVEILESSPDRRPAPCAMFGECGGCRVQDLNYGLQCKWKQTHVQDALRHIASLRETDWTLHPIIASPDEWRYRNKMEFSFGPPLGDATGISIGLHRAGEWSKTLDCPDCLLAPEAFVQAAEFFRRELSALAVADSAVCAYNPKFHTGLLRALVLRHSVADNTFLVALLTNEAPKFAKAAAALGEKLMAQFPNCRGYLWGTTTALSDVAVPEVVHIQMGDGFIEETLGARTYRISPFSFFQTNSRGATVLYDKVRELAQLDGGNLTVLDAYCGTGTIGIHCADLAKKIVGIEIVESAVTDAQHNAVRNGFDNCEFHAGDMRQVLGKLRVEGKLPAFDRVIVDPPRGGMEAKALKLLLDLGAPVIVYVSCNPTTLARDIVQMNEAGYVVEVVQPVDMFPHTFHVESIVRLRRTQ